MLSYRRFLIIKNCAKRSGPRSKPCVPAKGCASWMCEASTDVWGRTKKRGDPSTGSGQAEGRRHEREWVMGYGRLLLITHYPLQQVSYAPGLFCKTRICFCLAKSND